MTDAFRLRTVRGQYVFLVYLGVACIGVGGVPDVKAQNPFGSRFGNTKKTSTSGLQGLHRRGVPLGLQQADFDGLENRWQPLANPIVKDIVAFFNEKPDSIAAQRKALETLLQHAKQLRQASREETDPSQQALLLSLSGQLKRKAELYWKTLRVLETNALANPLLAARIRLDNLEDHLSNQKGTENDNSAGWTKYLKLEDLDKSLNPEPEDAPDKNDDQKTKSEAGSREAVEVTRERLRPLPSHSELVRETLSSQPFSALANALDSLLNQWESATASNNDAIIRYRKLRDAVSRKNPEDAYDRLGFLPTVSDYEKARIERRVNGQMAIDIQTEFHNVSEVAEESAMPLGQWLRRTYFNYDTHTTAFEGALQDLADRRDRRIEPVQEVVAGAQVSGHSDTVTTTTIDVIPNDSAAELHLLVNGVTNSHTVGERCNISVRNAGRADFKATKPVYITPDGFRTAPAGAGAQAGNMPYDPQTPISCLPVFGTVLENLTLKEARSRIPDANAMTRRRVVTRLTQELDEQVGNGLIEAEKMLREGQLARLEKYDLHPKAAEYRSTDTLVFLTNRITRSDEFGGGELPVDFVEESGFTLHVHESAMTAFVDRASLENRTMDEKALRAEFERYFSDLFGQDLDFSAEVTGPDKFTFFEQDNIRVVVEGGEVYVLLRAKFEVEENVSPQLISIPFRLDMKGDKILLRRGKGQDIYAETLPEYEEDDDVRQNQRSGVLVSTGVRNQFEKSIPATIEFPRFIELKTPEEPIRYFVRRITAVNGWLSAWLIPEDDAASVIASEAEPNIPLPEAPEIETAPSPES
ncbi:hypothetical protein [Thalassoroseus pseudoceratinae]|uniref:hypothetical protein n=1 Tax=Thalassoroseus pseudoceratinae TaxID=2713176 RepID=UPI00141F1F30|nr:hypothetical protein [Thalassoroseus pseudoceratinae]